MTVLAGKQLYIANAGDCRAVLCRAGKAIPLTRDHKPTVYEERQRVESEGGFVEFEALNGALEVTRAVGDVDPLTGEKMKGLTAEPETDKIYLTDDDEFVIVACDGLWDVCESDVAVTWARHSLQEENDAQKASYDLVAQALRKGSVDNVTAVVIAFTKIAPDGSQYIVPNAAQEKQIKKQIKESTEGRRPVLGARAFQTIRASLATCEARSPTRSPRPSSTAPTAPTENKSTNSRPYRHPFHHSRPHPPSSTSSQYCYDISPSRSTSSLSTLSSRSSSSEDLTKILRNESRSSSRSTSRSPDKDKYDE